MHIEFERTGGIAGITLKTSLESSSLSDEEAHELQSLIEDTAFFSLPHSLTSPEGEADRFYYRILVDDGAQQHSVETSEAAVPDSLWPLLDWLTQQARSR